MTPHQLINAVCVRLDSDEFDPALVDLLAAALTRRHCRQLAGPESDRVREVEVRADIVHRYLLAHNLRAVGGNFDGRALYGLPFTMNGVGYERKDGARVVDA